MVYGKVTLEGTVQSYWIFGKGQIPQSSGNEK